MAPAARLAAETFARRRSEHLTMEAPSLIFASFVADIRPGYEYIPAFLSPSGVLARGSDHRAGFSLPLISFNGGREESQQADTSISAASTREAVPVKVCFVGALICGSVNPPKSRREARREMANGKRAMVFRCHPLNRKSRRPEGSRLYAWLQETESRLARKSLTATGKASAFTKKRWVSEGL